MNQSALISHVRLAAPEPHELGYVSTGLHLGPPVLTEGHAPKPVVGLHRIYSQNIGSHLSAYVCRWRV